MKLFTCILVVIILILSITPIVGVHCNVSNWTTNIEINSDQEDNETEGDETCPLLCGCQCGHRYLISITSSRMVSNPVLVNNIKLPETYSEGTSFDLIHSIWHPPKIS